MAKDFRINGFEQIKAFYSWVFNNADKRVTSQHISLYMFLLNQGNRNNWVEWFKCPFDLAMTGACIGNKKTYYSCLADLVEWGLIQYQKGANEWKAPLIKLEVLNSTSTDTATVPQSEPLVLPLVLPLPTPLPTHIYKLITTNIKRVTDNIETIIEFLDSNENIVTEDKGAGGKRERFTNIPPKIIDVQERIKERGITNFTAEVFHAHYTSKGWMIGKNPMKNWDAALTTWQANSNSNSKPVNGNKPKTRLQMIYEQNHKDEDY